MRGRRGGGGGDGEERQDREYERRVTVRASAGPGPGRVDVGRVEGRAVTVRLRSFFTAGGSSPTTSIARVRKSGDR